MKDLVEFVVKQLVTLPDAVTVEESRQDGNTNLILHVDPADMGMVIGKKGQTIRAIRKLLTVRAMAENVRVNLQLFDPGRTDGEVAETETDVKTEASATKEPESDQAETEKAETDEEVANDAEPNAEPEAENSDEKSAA